MAASVAGIFILVVYLAGAMMMFRANLFAGDQINGSIRQAARLSGDRVRTVIEISSVTSSGACDLSLELKNTGGTTIHEFELMDVIVQFDGGVNTSRSLAYLASGAPGLDQWVNSGVSGAFQPGILNPGETLSIYAELLLTDPEAATVTVSTPNGVIDTASSPVLNPCP